ncbi:MAG: hypothetical protein GX878_09110 [Firmicutes bacterium]|nr:hypothetical protein [Bacillota bacterium]
MANNKKPPVKRTVVPANKNKARVEGETADHSKGDPVIEKTPKQRAATMRLLAVLFWLVAIASEVVVILLFNGTLYIPGNEMVYMIAGIALILIFVVIGSQLWKRANRIDPVSKKNKLKFYLWNQMGLIAAVIAFFPLVLLLLQNKELDKKTKQVLTIIAVVAFLVAGVFSIDYNPVSSEDLEQAISDSQILSDGMVYWTRWGKKYHFDVDCYTLSRSAVIYEGTIEEAFEANRTSPCSICAVAHPGGGEEEEE